VLKKDSRNKSADVPDVRADEPERAMEQFTAGLRRVLAAPKAETHTRKRVRTRQSKRKSTR
jgi:hypothetical protein